MTKLPGIAVLTVAVLLTAACGGRMQAPSGEIEPIEAPAPVTGIDAISASAVNAHPGAKAMKEESGPVVARTQILLDRARFSVGVVNGKATKNTTLAIYWFQKSRNLPATSVLDSATYASLLLAAGPGPAVAKVIVDSAMISGPFIELPRNVYEQAKLRCLCYASVSEKIAERFHSTIEMMRKLNPGVAFAALEPGDTIWAPALQPSVPPRPVKRIQVSKTGNYVHAFAADGSLVFHFPSTLGSRYDPSPTGKFRVTAVAWNPVYRYDPRLFSEVADHKPGALLPAGPNSPVGTVWIATSKAHIGIHGTPNPETIGFASSHGCVRLTNWDATRLGRATSGGTPVEFTA